MANSEDNKKEFPEGINRPYKGRLLVSSPALVCPPFSRSAVFLLESDSKGGHIGLILNKPMAIDMSVLLPGWAEGSNWPIYCGGPVDGERLFMLHTLGEIFEGSTEISPGIYIGGDLNDIGSYLEQGKGAEGLVRLFLGYSGWTPGQLEEEIREGAWFVKGAPTPGDIFAGDGAGYWRREMSAISPAHGSLSLMPEIQQLN